MSNADKRTVATDALETLGTIIGKGQGRDAIHLAVEPIQAAERLFPGQDVGLVDGMASGKAKKHLGIVDPFIRGAIEKGEYFWLVVYPRQITSLRHVWEHPDFGETVMKVYDADPAKAALQKFADELGCSLDELLDNATAYAEHGDYWIEGGRFEGQGIPDDFWDNYEKVTGKKAGDRWSFFSCSC